MTGVGTVVKLDIPPYFTVAGNPSTPFGTNAEGLKRRGFSADGIMAIKRAYKTLYKSGLTLDQATEALRGQAAEHPELNILIDFIGRSERGIIR